MSLFQSWIAAIVGVLLLVFPFLWKGVRAGWALLCRRPTALPAFARRTLDRCQAEQRQADRRAERLAEAAANARWGCDRGATATRTVLILTLVGVGIVIAVFAWLYFTAPPCTEFDRQRGICADWSRPA